jgi:hypothetical protein
MRFEFQSSNASDNNHRHSARLNSLSVRYFTTSAVANTNVFNTASNSRFTANFWHTSSASIGMTTDVGAPLIAPYAGGGYTAANMFIGWVLRGTTTPVYRPRDIIPANIATAASPHFDAVWENRRYTVASADVYVGAGSGTTNVNDGNSFVVYRTPTTRVHGTNFTLDSTRAGQGGNDYTGFTALTNWYTNRNLTGTTTTSITGTNTASSTIYYVRWQLNAPGQTTASADPNVDYGTEIDLRQLFNPTHTRNVSYNYSNWARATGGALPVWHGEAGVIFNAADSGAYTASVSATYNRGGARLVSGTTAITSVANRATATIRPIVLRVDNAALISAAYNREVTHDPLDLVALSVNAANYAGNSDRLSHAIETFNEEFNTGKSWFEALGRGLRLGLDVAGTFDNGLHNAGLYSFSNFRLLLDNGTPNTNYQLVASPTLLFEILKRVLSIEYSNRLQSFNDPLNAVGAIGIDDEDFEDLIAKILVNNAWQGGEYTQYTRLMLSALFNNPQDNNNFTINQPVLQLTFLRLKDAEKYEFWVHDINDLMQLASDVAGLNAAHSLGIGVRPSYFQTADISGIIGWNMAEVDTVGQFFGVYDGGGKTISYVVFRDRASGGALGGMFGILSGTVRDLNFREVVGGGVLADVYGSDALIANVTWQGYIYADDVQIDERIEAVGFINGVFFNESQFSHAEIVGLVVKDFYLPQGTGTVADPFRLYFFRQLPLIDIYTFARFWLDPSMIIPRGYGE